jgi:pimeloyl-ACP methyl ester carboxylesterase
MKKIKILWLIAVPTLLAVSCEKKAEFVDFSDWAEMGSTGIETNFHVIGNEKSKVDLVFIHGMAVDNQSWLNQVDYFKNKARVININLPYVGDGTTYDTETQYNFELLADAVHSVLQKLKSVRAVIVGHSSGFAVAKELAIKYPQDVSKIINVDFEPFFYPPVGSPAREGFIDFIENTFLPGICSGVMKEGFISMMCPPGITPESVTAYFRSEMYAFPGVIGCQLFNCLTREELFQYKGWNDIPLLSIHVSEKDEVFRANMATAFPGVQFMILPVPSGHFIQMEHPDLFNEIVENFVFK